jgi:hypothetical protein
MWGPTRFTRRSEKEGREREVLDGDKKGSGNGHGHEWVVSCVCVCALHGGGLRERVPYPPFARRGGLGACGRLGEWVGEILQRAQRALHFVSRAPLPVSCGRGAGFACACALSGACMAVVVVLVQKRGSPRKKDDHTNNGWATRGGGETGKKRGEVEKKKEHEKSLLNLHTRVPPDPLSCRPSSPATTLLPQALSPGACPPLPKEDPRSSAHPLSP